MTYPQPGGDVSMQLNEEYLWLMRPHALSGSVRLAAVPELSGVDAQAITRGDKAITQPLLFRRTAGTCWTDFPSLNELFISIVSMRILDALRSAGCTGWSSRPVRIEPVPQCMSYAVLIVMGRCGPRVPPGQERPVTLLPTRPEGRPVLSTVGFSFDSSTHDNSDIVLAGRASAPIVTAKTKVALEAAGIQGLRFERLDWIRN